MTNEKYPRLILPDDYDERARDEAGPKGYISGALIELENGKFYKAYFTSPTRLRQDLEMEVTLGRPYIAEPGLVVVPEIAIESIEGILGQLVSDGFFENLKPLGG